MAPVYHAWEDDAVYVAEYSRERFAVLRSLPGELCSDVARFFIRRHTHFVHVLAEIRNPVRQLMQLFAKFLRWCVADWLLIFHS